MGVHLPFALNLWNIFVFCVCTKLYCPSFASTHQILSFQQKNVKVVKAPKPVVYIMNNRPSEEVQRN